MISTPSALKVAPQSNSAQEHLDPPTGVDRRQPTAQAIPRPKNNGPARIHAVVVHHRGQEMLDICLRTVLESEGVELDVVVVSNHCLEPLPDLVEEHPRVHVVETGKPIGFSEANNVGVRWAKHQMGPADYYYFLNNDTESRPDTLSELVSALYSRPRAAAAGPLTLIQAFPDHLNSLGINVTVDAWGWDEGIGQRLESYGPLPEAREVLTITGSAYLVEAEIYDRVGGWTEAYEWYFEDIDLGIKIWKQGREVLHVPQAEILHRVSATMTVGAERKQYFFWRNRLVLALIHWPTELLWPLLRRAVYWEILKAPWADSRLQRKALLGALPLVPKALLLRRKLRGPEDWKKLLRPAGSVPVIKLPGTDTAAQAPESESAANDTNAETSAETSAGGSADGGAMETRPELPVGSDTGVQNPELVRGRRAMIPAPGDPWRAATEFKAQHAPAEESTDSAPKRVLVVGWGPLPFEEQRMNYAPGTRSLQFAQALADAGHGVCLAYARIPGSYFGQPADLITWREENLLIYQMGLPTFDHPGALEGLVKAFDPHVLVGAAPLPSRRALRLADDRPVWVDLFGDPMAEAQAKDRAQPDGEDGDHLTAYWQLMQELLARGDAFSSVSARQRYAVIGQLGVSGRLNRATAGRELVHVVPCSIDCPAAAPPEIDEPTKNLPAALPDGYGDSFLVLWSGGFNTWCDVDTLFDGLEIAMSKEPNLRFVATGGAIEKHDSGTFHRLRSRVSASLFADRFALLGCLPKERADQIRDRADLLVVTERPLYERELGSSGRLLDWIARGRPCLCTRQSEIGALIATHGLGLSYETGNAASFAERVLEGAADPDRLQELGRKAQIFAHEHFSHTRTTEPLVAWVASGGRAPDLVVGSKRRKYRALADRLDRSNQAEERLHALYGTPPYRVYKKIRSLLKG